jgi:hypothetical protein
MTEYRFTTFITAPTFGKAAAARDEIVLRAGDAAESGMIPATVTVSHNHLIAEDDTGLRAARDTIDAVILGLTQLGFGDDDTPVNGGDCVDFISGIYDKLAKLGTRSFINEHPKYEEIRGRIQVGTRVLSINGETSDTDHGERHTGENAIGTITAIDYDVENCITLAFEPSEVSVVLNLEELIDEDQYEIDPDEPVYTTREEVIRAVEGWLGHEGSYELATRVYEYMREQGMVEHNGVGFVIERDTNVFEIAADLSRADLPDSYPPELAIADHQLTADQLFQKYATKRDNGEHPQYLRRDWRHDVAEDNTLLGYWQWVEHQIEQDRD